MNFRIGLFIPANPWQDVRKVVLPLEENGSLQLDPLRKVLNCRVLEALYPQTMDYLEEYVPDVSFVMFGDEEGRLIDNPRENVRATMLFDYSYLIVGDVVVFSDHAGPDGRHTGSIPTDMLDLLKNGNL